MRLGSDSDKHANLLEHILMCQGKNIHDIGLQMTFTFASVFDVLLICNIHPRLSFFDWNFFISIESLKFYQELGEVFIQFFLH